MVKLQRTNQSPANQSISPAGTDVYPGPFQLSVCFDFSKWQFTSKDSNAG